jgi:hypothetical protein
MPVTACVDRARGYLTEWNTFIAAALGAARTRSAVKAIYPDLSCGKRYSIRKKCPQKFPTSARVALSFVESATHDTLYYGFLFWCGAQALGRASAAAFLTTGSTLFLYPGSLAV